MRWAFKPRTKGFGTAAQLSPAGRPASGARVATDDHGNAIAVWVAGDGEPVVQSAFRRAGKSFGSRTDTSPSPAPTSRRSSSTSAATRSQSGPGSSETWVRSRRRSGRGRDLRRTPGRLAGRARRQHFGPEIAVDESAAVVWTRADTGTARCGSCPPSARRAATSASARRFPTATCFGFEPARRGGRARKRARGVDRDRRGRPRSGSLSLVAVRLPASQLRRGSRVDGARTRAHTYIPYVAETSEAPATEAGGAPGEAARGRHGGVRRAGLRGRPGRADRRRRRRSPPACCTGTSRASRSSTRSCCCSPTGSCWSTSRRRPRRTCPPTSGCCAASTRSSASSRATATCGG